MNILLKVFKFLFALCASHFSIYANCEEFPISVSISTESDLLVLSLFNRGERGVYISKWDFPFHGKIESDYFDISSVSDGGRPDFLGKIIKRKEPGISDIFLLDSHKSVDVKVYIKNFYRLKNEFYLVRVNKITPLYSVTGNTVKIAGFTELSSNKISYTPPNKL